MKKESRHINMTTILSTFIMISTIIGIVVRLENRLVMKEDLQPIDARIENIEKNAITHKDYNMLKASIDTSGKSIMKANSAAIRILIESNNKMYDALDDHIRNQKETDKIIKQLDKLNGRGLMYYQKDIDSSLTYLDIRYNGLFN